jgi:hypothetical protein
MAGYVKTCILMQPNRNADEREISHNQPVEKNALALPIAEIGGGTWDQLEISFLNRG